MFLRVFFNRLTVHRNAFVTSYNSGQVDPIQLYRSVCFYSTYFKINWKQTYFNTETLIMVNLGKQNVQLPNLHKSQIPSMFSLMITLKQFALVYFGNPGFTRVTIYILFNILNLHVMTSLSEINTVLWVRGEGILYIADR